MDQIQKFSTVVKKQREKKQQTVGVIVWSNEKSVTSVWLRRDERMNLKKMEMENKNHNLLVEILFLWFWASRVFFQDTILITLSGMRIISATLPSLNAVYDLRSELLNNFPYSKVNLINSQNMLLPSLQSKPHPCQNSS